MSATTFNVPLYTEGSKFQGPNISVKHIGGQANPIIRNDGTIAFAPEGVTTDPSRIAEASAAQAQASAAELSAAQASAAQASAAQASAAELSAQQAQASAAQASAAQEQASATQASATEASAAQEQASAAQASAAQASAAEASAAEASAAQGSATDPWASLLYEAENAGKLASAAQASAAEASAALEADSGAKQTASAALFTASAAQEAALHQYEKEHMLDILFELLVKPKFINNTILLEQNEALTEPVAAVGGSAQGGADWSFKTDTSGNTVLVDSNGITRGVYEYASGASGDPSVRSLQTWTTHRDFESSGAEKTFYATNPSGAIYLRDPRADDKVFIPNPFSTTSVPGRIPFNIPFKDHIMNMDQKLNSIMITLKSLSETVMSMQAAPAEEAVEEEAVEEEAPEEEAVEEEVVEEEPAVGGRKRKTRRKRRSA